MRKFLWVVAVGALVLAVAAPAMALDFKFGSEYRVRLYDGVNVGFNDTVGTNPRGAQLRVRPRFDVSDDNGNIQATLRLEIGDVEFGNGGGAASETNVGFTTFGVRTATSLSPGGARVGNGAGGSIGLDGVNVETKWAYMDFALPFGIPARVRAGLQPWYLPKGIIVDDDAAGIRAYGKLAPVSYEAFWYRVSGGPATAAPPAGAAGQTPTSNTLDNNNDYYGTKLDFALLPWLNPGVYYIFGDNRVQCSTAATTCGGRTRQSHYVGLTVTGKIGIVSYDLDWVYGQAKGGPLGNFGEPSLPGGAVANPILVRGWALDGAVHFPVGPVTVNLAGSVATGDKQNGGDSEAFPSIAASWNGAGGGFEMIGSGGPFDAVEFTQDPPTNLWMIGGWVTYNPVKALTLKGGYAFAGFTTRNGNCANFNSGNTPSFTCFGPQYMGRGFTPVFPGLTQGSGGLAGKSSLGHELTFRADYDLWTGFKLQGQVGWIFPTAGSTAGEYVLQMLYNF